MVFTSHHKNEWKERECDYLESRAERNRIGMYTKEREVFAFVAKYFLCEICQDFSFALPQLAEDSNVTLKTIQFAMPFVAATAKRRRRDGCCSEDIKSPKADNRKHTVIWKTRSSQNWASISIEPVCCISLFGNWNTLRILLSCCSPNKRGIHR